MADREGRANVSGKGYVAEDVQLDFTTSLRDTSKDYKFTKKTYDVSAAER